MINGILVSEGEGLRLVTLCYILLLHLDGEMHLDTMAQWLQQGRKVEEVAVLANRFA